MHFKSLLLCPILCDPLECSLHGSSVHGILQARILPGLLFPPPGDLPDQGLNPRLFHLMHWQAGSLPLATWEAYTLYILSIQYDDLIYVYNVK